MLYNEGMAAGKDTHRIADLFNGLEPGAT